jgi:hypothetical protein
MYIPLQRAYSIPSIFRIILYWNQVSFQDHLVLEYSGDVIKQSCVIVKKRARIPRLRKGR